MPRLIGNAYIALLPDATMFRADADSKIKAALAGLRPTVTLTGNTKDIDAKIAAIAAALKGLDSEATLGLNTDRALGDVAGLSAALDALVARLDNIPVSLDDSRALAKLYSILAGVNTLSKQLEDLGDADFDIDKALAKFYTLDASAKVLAADMSDLTPDMDVAKMTAKVAIMAADVEALSALLADMRANTDDTSALAKIVSMQAAALKLAKSLNNMPSNIDTLPYEASILKMTASADALKAKLEAVSAVPLVNPDAPAEVTALGEAAAIAGSKFIQAGVGGAGAWGFLTNRIVLFAGVLDNVMPEMLTRVSVWHVAADWIVEFAAVLGPAIIAVSAWGAAVTPVFLDAYNRLHAMQEAASATGTAIGVFNYNAQGAIGPMQQLQNSLQPGVWELTGDAIEVMTKKTGVFSSLVGQVNTVVEDLAARMTEAFSSQGATNFMKNGALDFQRFGTIIGNLGGAFGNFIKLVPGYAEIIEELFEKISAGVEAFTVFAAPVIKAGLALHGFFLYTGLAISGGVALIAGLGNVIAKMFTFVATTVDVDTVLLRLMYAWDAASGAVVVFSKSMLALALNPYVLAIAALGLLVYDMTINWDSASASVSKFGTNLTATIAGMTGGNALQAIPAAFGKINDEMKTISSPAYAQSIAANWDNIGNSGNRIAKDFTASGEQFKAAWNSLTTSSNPFSGLVSTLAHVGDAFKDMTASGGAAAAQQLQITDDANAMKTAYSQLNAQQKNLLTVTGQLMSGQTGATKTTFNWAQSLGILNAAGVQSTDSLQMMQTKVQGLLTGWKQYGLTATQIGNSVNAIALSTEMQQSAVSTLTGAYSSFIGVVTGGETALSTFGTGMATLASSLSAAKASGVSFSDTLGKFTVTGTAAGATMNGLSQASLNVRSAFASQVTNATSLYNSLLTLSSVSGLGAKGQDLLAQAGKDMVAQLLPLARGSASAMAEVSALAQIAGGPATTSFQALSAWVGKTKDPMANLNSIEQQLTRTSANLAADAQNLAGAMGETLTTAISGAVFAAEKGPAALQALANSLEALSTGKGSASAVINALQQFAPALVQMTGSIPNAKNEFLTMAGTMGVGTRQANALWNAIGEGATPLNAVQTVTKEFNDKLTSLYNSGINPTAAAAKQLWATLRQQYLDTLATKAGETEGAFVKTAGQLGVTKKAADELWTSMHKLAADSPYTANVKTNVSASGEVKAVETGNAAYGIKNAMLGALQFSGMAAGGVVPAGGGPAGRDSRLVTVAPGELIVPTSHAAMFGDMAKRAGIPGFASGGMVADAVQMSNIVPTVGQASTQFATGAAQSFVNTVKNAAVTLGSLSGPIPPTSPVMQQLIAEAINADHAPPSWLPAIELMISKESGGNPSAVDPISVLGEHAMGLMQMLPTTFGMYSGGNIMNPLTNLEAAIKYIMADYGSPYNIVGIGRAGTYKGYSGGGAINEPVYGRGAWSGMGYSFAENGQPEYVSNSSQAAASAGSDTMVRLPLQQMASTLAAIQRQNAQLPNLIGRAIGTAGGNGLTKGYYSAQN